MNLVVSLYYVQKATSIIKVKYFVKKQYIFLQWKWASFFSSLMTLNKFVFYFFCHAPNNPFEVPNVSLATCMIQINQLLVVPFIWCLWPIAGQHYMLYRNTKLRTVYISVSCRPQPWRGRTNQCNFPRLASLIYPEAPQMNELGGDLSVNCADHSVFLWSVRLVTDLCLWCKVKWTVEGIIWTILVKRKLVTKRKVSWGGALIIRIEFLYWSHSQDNCLTHRFILLG